MNLLAVVWSTGLGSFLGRLNGGIRGAGEDSQNVHKFEQRCVLQAKERRWIVADIWSYGIGL